MKRRFWIIGLIALSLLILFGCSIEGWQYTWDYHGIGTEYDGDLSFTLLEPEENMAPRMDHASVVFDGKIWVFGGYNPNVRGDKDPYLEDIWYSEDGSYWVNVTMDAPWKGRRGHEVIVYRDNSNEEALYLIGGYKVEQRDGISYGGAANDVWKSTDGIHWTEIKENSYKTKVTHPNLDPNDDVRGTDLYDPSDDTTWYPRLNHSVIVHNNKMYLIGGFAKEQMPYLNDGNRDQMRKYFADIWSSTDGETWTQEEPMYVDSHYADVYGKYSAGRASFGSFIHNNEIYLVGGTSAFEFQENGEDFVVPSWEKVWKGAIGKWDAITNGDSEYIERRSHEVVKYKDNYWILPGCNPAAIQWYHGKDSIWKVDGTTLAFTRDGSYRTGTPMYGISNYTAEVFTPQGGEEAIYILFGDGDGGVRNTVWKVTEKESE